jgi:hypothetical protein
MTPDDGLRLQIEIYRRMTPQQRLQESFRLYELGKTIARQGVKNQHPDWSSKQVDAEVVRRCLLGAGIS